MVGPGGGTRHVFGSGGVQLVEDTTGQGRTTVTNGDQACVTYTITLANQRPAPLGQPARMQESCGHGVGHRRPTSLLWMAGKPADGIAGVKNSTDRSVRVRVVQDLGVQTVFVAQTLRGSRFSWLELPLVIRLLVVWARPDLLYSPC